MRLLLIVLTGLFFVYPGKPRKPYVPDEVTAFKIAEAVWTPIYGEKHVNTVKPFISAMEGDTVWHVCGTLPKSRKEIDDQGNEVFIMTLGGVPHIRIQKSDGKILDVFHTK